MPRSWVYLNYRAQALAEYKPKTEPSKTKQQQKEHLFRSKLSRVIFKNILEQALINGKRELSLPWAQKYLPIPLAIVLHLHVPFMRSSHLFGEYTITGKEAELLKEFSQNLAQSHFRYSFNSLNVHFLIRTVRLSVEPPLGSCLFLFVYTTSESTCSSVYRRQLVSDMAVQAYSWNTKQAAR